MYFGDSERWVCIVEQFLNFSSLVAYYIYIIALLRQRIHNRQTTVLLRNSVIHIAINASIMGLDSFCMGYNIYVLSAKNLVIMQPLMERTLQLPTQLLVVSVNLATPILMFPTLEDLILKRL